MSNVANGLELAGRLRGIVEDNKDPLKLGRLKVRVESAYGQQPKGKLPWAWPTWAHGGIPRTGFFDVPEEGAVVWVEFLWKDGKPDTTYPLWGGTWLGKGDTPAEVQGPPEDAHFHKVYRTPAGHLLLFRDKPGEECIEIHHGTGGQTITLTKDGGITVSARGVINITSGQTVNISAPAVNISGDISCPGKCNC